ncbi:MAG: putative Ig domain-containing protein, partial [Myxococcota bacterium]
MRYRDASLFLVLLAALNFGCGSCGGEEDGETTAPEITSEPVTEAVVGEEYRYHLTVTGEPEPTVTATGADGAELPPWLAFDEETLTLLGLPPESQIGVHEVVITASNGTEPDAEQSFEIEVSQAGVAPDFVTDPITEAYTGEEYVYVAEVTGTPDPVITATDSEGGPLAEWLDFDGESGTLSGTPGIDDIGEYDVLLTADNGIEPAATQDFTITVERSEEAPVITSSAETEVTEGELYSYEITATGYPEPVIAAGGADGADLPEWLVLEENLLSGTPEAADVGEH